MLTEPARPLTADGLSAWHRLAPEVTPCGPLLAEALLLLCEQIDERTELRRAVAEFGHWRDRAALRTIDSQITAGLGTIAGRSAVPDVSLPLAWDLSEVLGDPK